MYEDKGYGGIDVPNEMDKENGRTLRRPAESGGLPVEMPTQPIDFHRVIHSANGTLDVEEPIGTIRFGRYRYEAKIGEGGFGVVYRAYDLHLGRTVAIKEMSDRFRMDPGAIARFRREALSAARLNHPSIVTVYDWHDVGDVCCIVMEHVPGQSLTALLRDGRRLPLPRVCAILSQVCRAFDHAHCHGVLHRDIKPDNILITSDGTAKVTDFGIAEITRGAGVEVAEGWPSVHVYGTPAFMAPEQRDGGSVGPQADVFSLGVLAYYMVTGTLPYGSFGARRGTAPAPKLFTVRAGIPPGLDRAILRAIDPDPVRRAADTAEILAALEASLQDRPQPGVLRGSERPSGRMGMLPWLSHKSWLSQIGKAIPVRPPRIHWMAVRPSRTWALSTLLKVWPRSMDGLLAAAYAYAVLHLQVAGQPLFPFYPDAWASMLMPVGLALLGVFSLPLSLFIASAAAAIPVLHYQATLGAGVIFALFFFLPLPLKLAPRQTAYVLLVPAATWAGLGLLPPLLAGATLGPVSGAIVAFTGALLSESLAHLSAWEPLRQAYLSVDAGRVVAYSSDAVLGVLGRLVDVSLPALIGEVLPRVVRPLSYGSDVILAGLPAAAGALFASPILGKVFRHLALRISLGAAAVIGLGAAVGRVPDPTDLVFSSLVIFLFVRLLGGGRVGHSGLGTDAEGQGAAGSPITSGTRGVRAS